MKIDKIKKARGNKYNLHLSNNEKIATYDEVILKNNLLFQKEIDSSLLNKIEIDTKYYGVYNKVLKYITTRLRSKKEVATYLDKCGILDGEKDQIIKQLLDKGLVNDYNFTKAYINDKIYLSNYGPDKIKNDLYGHDIDPNVIELEIANIDNVVIKEKMMKLVDKKIKVNHKYSDYQLKQKIIFELVSLGYNKEMVIEYIKGITTNNNNVLSKQYDKIYSRLSRKYSDKELLLKVRQQLYQKGFNGEEIDNLINEKVENY